jgi:hypothetical protein
MWKMIRRRRGGGVCRVRLRGDDDDNGVERWWCDLLADHGVDVVCIINYVILGAPSMRIEGGFW